ncbi:MAG: hypothetical protein L0Y56_15270, partial [Nitrospira sp.]|nr:hypothetical protein [Nitrospira sp.]
FIIFLGPGTPFSLLGGLEEPWGQSGDIPVPADYNGDGEVDLAVWRVDPVNPGTWFILPLRTRIASIQQFGRLGDFPVPGDYNGNGVDDLSVLRFNSVDEMGTWLAILQ